MRVCLIAICLVLLATSAYAHGGRLDKYGCHANKKRFGNTTSRECHRGVLAGQWFTSLEAQLAAYQAALSLTLSWNANTETDLAGYRVYCGTISKVYSMHYGTREPKYIIANLPRGKTYYCAVTAYNTANYESPFSVEVSKTIP